MTTFRTSIDAIAPPWLKGTTAGGLLYSIAIILDAMHDVRELGVKASFPNYAPPDALGYIGNDRQIERGPAETGASYAARLQRAFETWSVAGNAAKMLESLRIYFYPATPELRAVSARSVWHEIDNALVVTRSHPLTSNWNWDGGSVKRHKGWVIINSTHGPYAKKRWGDGHRYGDGTTWGSTATQADVDNVQRLVLKWKPARSKVEYILITFNDSLWESTDVSPPNPNGQFVGDTPYPRLGVEALFWKAGPST